MVNIVTINKPPDNYTLRGHISHGHLRIVIPKILAEF